jgi:Dyp-type peroxidase family
MNPLLRQKKIIDFAALRDAVHRPGFARTSTDSDVGFYHGLFENMQGNILKAHGRPHAALVMLRLSSQPARNRDFLRSLIRDARITSTWQQLNDQRDFQLRKSGRAAEVRSQQAAAGEAPFCSLALTDKGMDALGLTAEWRPHDSAFTNPMESPESRVGLSDATAETVETNEDPWMDDVYPQRIDAILLVAHATLTGLARLITEAWERGRAFGARVLAVENGFAWKPGGASFKEPFGFTDGISNPVFIPSSNGADDHPPAMALEDVIVADQSPLHAGSYLVYRKLEQDMVAFRDFERELDAKLAGRTQLNAAEVLVGRDRDGQPLANLRSPGRNDFDFAGDRAVPPRCPFHAHIRKSNPRLNDSILMVRRSMVYAEQGDPDSATLEGRRGLLFLAYMSKIAEKFELLHTGWLMTAKSQEPGLGSQPWLAPLLGPDPLLGPPGDYTLAHSSGLPVFTLKGRPRLVIPRGGRYGFVPPLSWLGALPS